MPRSSRVHYIASTDFSITPNCNGSPNDLALTIARGARIHVYSEGAGIDLQDNTFQSWKLIGHNRRLAEGDKPYTIYARLSKKYKDSNNYIEFAPMGRHGDDWVDKWSSVTPDGFSVLYKDGDREVKNISENYWYIRLGEVSLPEDGKRSVELDLGILGTDQYNIDWILNPDGKPFNVEIRCTVDGSDAGTAPYVQMGKTMNLKAVLKEGWGTSASEKFDHWGIERVTGDGTADAQWSRTASDGAFKTTGTIDIPHTRDVSDGFAGAVAAVFKVTAYTVEDDPESETGKKDVPLASGSITAYAETSEHYELVPSVVAVSYDPGSGEFIPKDGVQVRIRRTDEDGSVSDITYAQFEAAALSVQHAEADSDAWTALAVGGAADAVVVLTVPTSAFANYKDVNVRLLRTMAAPGAEPVAVEIARKTIAFSRDTQDTEDREWIFLRSTESIVFGTEAHPEPADIPMGQVNPPEAASGTVTDKQQAGWVPNGWWDDEHGVNSTWYYEYASYRDYVHEDGGGHWGDFVPAMLWNHYKDTVTEDEIIDVVGDKFLSKVLDDEAHGVITFLKGIKIGIQKLFGWDANGTITANGINAAGDLDVRGTRNYIDKIKSHNYSGDTLADTGWSITNDHYGHSKLTIDEIYVRMKAVFESLEVKERTYTGGDQIWSCAGNYVVRTDYMGDSNVEEDLYEDGSPYDGTKENMQHGLVTRAGETYGHSTVKVPWLLNGMALVLGANNGLVRGLFARYKDVRITLKRSTARGKGGTGGEADEEIIRKIKRVRCYFLAKDGDREIHNWWRINDLARCQTMNLSNINRETYLEETSHKTGNVFWWRKVIDVSYNPVQLGDGKWYHYFDVAFDSTVEESADPAIHATMATFALEGSDIPAAGDSVVQFGNTLNAGRMNLMMMEVNGGDVTTGFAPSGDAPCLKAYKGIYCFSLDKCWTGGRPCKMKLSPSSGYEFYGPSIKFVTEYDVVPVPIERSEIYWTNICRLKDANGDWINRWSFDSDAYPRAAETKYSDDGTTGRDYSEYLNPDESVSAGAPVRKCYYLEKVSHRGCYFICSIVDGAHWEAQKTFTYADKTYSINQWISDGEYDALPAVYQNKYCKRMPNYTIEEPSSTSRDWTMTVNSGADPIAVYKWSQKEYMSDSDKPSITPAQWAAWTDGSQPIDGWTKNVPNRPEPDPDSYYLYQSQNKLYADGMIGMWELPIRVSGSVGTPGEDAEDTEWIYLRNDSKNNPGDPNSISKGQVSPNGTAAGNETNKQLDDWVPNGWSDNALEIAWNNKYVWASFRTKARGANLDPSIHWGDFSLPIIWSHWGQNGMDGDGVEYVYIRTKNNVAPIVAYNDNINRSYTKDGKTITYLDDDFLSVISNNDSAKTDTTKAWAESNTCTDDPKGISRDWPFEWCLSRTMTSPDAETGRRTWRCYGGEAAGDTETMVLLDHYGENAIRLDIDNEMDSVQTDSMGKVVATRVVSTVVHLWDGADEESIKDIDFTTDNRISGGPPSEVAAFYQGASGNGKLLRWTFQTGSTMATAYEIIISYTYLNVPRRCTFTIAASMGQAVYNIKPSLSSLPCTVNANNEYNNPPALPMSIVKLDGGSTDEINEFDQPTGGTIENGAVFIRYSLDSMPTGKTDGSPWPTSGSPAGTKAFGTVQANPQKDNVYIAIFNASNKLLDRETVPVIKNGKNGDVWTIEEWEDGHYYWFRNGVIYTDPVTGEHIKAEGKDGTGVEIKGGVDVLWNTEITASQPNSLEGLVMTPSNVGECYTVTANKHLYFYDGTSQRVDPDPDHDVLGNPAGWRDLGKFSGDDGKSSYMHIAYADVIITDAQGTVTSVTGFNVTKQKDSYDWVGLRTDDNPLDPGAQGRDAGSDLANARLYEWNYVRGAAGKNAENVNPNILLRTVFDNGIAPVKEKWTADWSHVFVDTATDTVTDGRKSIRISAYGLSTYVDFKQNVYGRLKAGTWYTLSFNSYSTNPWQTFIYSASESYACIDRTEWYTDGVRSTSVPINGRVDWPASWTGERHTITFKTSSSFSTQSIEIIFRALAGVQVCICMPKLEIGQTATAYMANEDDLAGADGAKGDDAVNVIVTPASLIVNQDLQNTSNLNNLSETVVFAVEKGASQLSVTAVSVTDTNHCNATGSSNNNNYATLTRILKNGTNYYDTADFTCTVTYNDNGTSRAVSGVKVRVYANLLGTWKQSVENGVSTEVGKQINYGLQDDGVIKKAYDADIEKSAKSLRSEYTEQMKRAGDYDRNLFGFHRGLVFGASDEDPVPFVQGYGLVFRGRQDGVRGGRISNIGLQGTGGEFTITCQMKLTSTLSTAAVMVEMCNVANTRGKGSVPAGSDYVTITTAWQNFEFHIDIPSDNAYLNTINGFLDFQGNWNSGPYIYVRHLSIQRGEKADFVEADEDISDTGKGNLATALSVRTVSEIPVAGTYTVETGVLKSGWSVAVNFSGWGSSETTRDYISQGGSFLLKTGSVYTLSYWARTNNAGMVITHHLYAPDITKDVSWGPIYDDGVATVMETLSNDGHSLVRLSTTWKRYFVRFYVTEESTTKRSLIALRMEKGQNLISGSSYRSGTVYIAGIEFQEGYVMDETRFNSLVEQNARRITLMQQTGLKKAGIDIGNGTVNLFGGRVTFSNSDGTVKDKVSIDPATGTLNAQDGNFGGVVRASQYYQAVQTIRIYDGNTGDIGTGKQIVVIESLKTSSSGATKNILRLPVEQDNAGVIMDIYISNLTSDWLSPGDSCIPCMIRTINFTTLRDNYSGTDVEVILSPGEKVRVYCNGANWYMMDGWNARYNNLWANKLDAKVVQPTRLCLGSNAYKEPDTSGEDYILTLPYNPVIGDVVFCPGCNKVKTDDGNCIQESGSTAAPSSTSLTFQTKSPRIFLYRNGFWKEFFCGE